MKTPDPFDALNARLLAFRRRVATVQAQEVLSVDRVNFSVTMLAILGRVADGRTVPGTVDMRRITAAWARWDKAGRRRTRHAAR